MTKRNENVTLSPGQHVALRYMMAESLAAGVDGAESIMDTLVGHDANDVFLEISHAVDSEVQDAFAGIHELAANAALGAFSSDKAGTMLTVTFNFEATAREAIAAMLGEADADTQ